MAMLKTFGRPEVNDKGIKFLFGSDPDKPGRDVSFFVRRCPGPKEDKIVEKYGRPKDVQLEAEGKSLWVNQRIMSVEDMENYARDKAKYCMVDTENFYLTPGDQEDVERIGKWLRQELQIGEEVCLDGRWSDELRHYVFVNCPPLVDWIMKKAGELDKDMTIRETKLAKNS